MGGIYINLDQLTSRILWLGQGVLASIDHEGRQQSTCEQEDGAPLKGRGEAVNLGIDPDLLA